MVVSDEQKLKNLRTVAGARLRPRFGDKTELEETLRATPERRIPGLEQSKELIHFGNIPVPEIILGPALVAVVGE